MAARDDSRKRLLELLPFLLSGVAYFGAMALQAWREQVTPAAQFAVGLLGLFVGAGTFLLGHLKRPTAAWRFGTGGGGLIVLSLVALFISGKPPLPPSPGPVPQTEQPRLVVHPADESIIAIERLHPDEIGRRVYRDGVSTFEFLHGPNPRQANAPDAPSAGDLEFELEFELTARRGDRLWVQTVRVDRCRERDRQFHCLLPKDLTWEPAAFVSLGGTDTNGSVVTRRVAAVVPSTGCTPLAGKSLSAGAAIFDASPRSIAVELMTDANWKEQRDPRREGFVAVAGTYNSAASREMIQSCGRHCGPILTFSSAHALRRGAIAPDWVFRMTSSNRKRAEDLIPVLAEEFSDLRDDRELQIVYNDDRLGEDGVHYAFDQALEFHRALKDNTAIPRPYWVRYDASGFAAADPLAPDPLPGAARLEVRDFDGLVAHLRARVPHAIALFIDLDEGILRFGGAVRRADGNGVGRLRWYVPGPRELFEGAWTQCFQGPTDLDALEGVRVLGPDDNNTSVGAWQFAELWSRSKFHTERVPSRAARMYDALQIINRAVRTLDRRLSNEQSVPGAREDERLAFVHLDLYRERLRDEIARTTYHGASGTFAFDEHGDMLSGSYVGEVRGGRLLPMAVRGEHTPAPTAPAVRSAL